MEVAFRSESRLSAASFAVIGVTLFELLIFGWFSLEMSRYKCEKKS